jgi:hypothetical protein
MDDAPFEGNIGKYRCLLWFGRGNLLQRVGGMLEQTIQAILTGAIGGIFFRRPPDTARNPFDPDGRSDGFC